MKAAVQHQVSSKAMQWQTLQKHHGLHWTHDGHSISGLNPARKQCRAMLTLAPDGLRAGCTVYSYSIQCVQRSWKRFLLCRSITSRATGVNRCPVGNTSSRFQDSVQPTNVRVCSFQHVYVGRILICVSSQCEVRSISSQLHHQNQNDINISNPQQHGASYTNSMVGFGFELDRNVLMWSHQTTEAWAPTAIRLDSKPQQPSKRVCMHGPCIGLTRSGEAMGTGPIKIDMENENTWVSHNIWHLFQLEFYSESNLSMWNGLGNILYSTQWTAASAFFRLRFRVIGGLYACSGAESARAASRSQQIFIRKKWNPVGFEGLFLACEAPNRTNWQNPKICTFIVAIKIGSAKIQFFIVAIKIGSAKINFFIVAIKIWSSRFIFLSRR